MPRTSRSAPRRRALALACALLGLVGSSQRQRRAVSVRATAAEPARGAVATSRPTLPPDAGASDAHAVAESEAANRVETESESTDQDDRVYAEVDALCGEAI